MVNNQMYHIGVSVLQDHHIRVLHMGEFSRLEFLESLTLTRCGIESIEANAFKGLHYVSALDLRSNLISRIEPYTFIGLFALRSLILDKNSIHVVADFAFHGVELHKLSLEQNPDLVNLSSKAFDGAKVEHLYLYNSSLTSESMSSLRPLRDSLVELSLQNNRRALTLRRNLFFGFSFESLHLNENGISNVSFLEHVSTADLSLEGNPIGSIDFSVFGKLAEVRRLRLGNTNLVNLNGSHFKGLMHLTELYVTDNNINTLPENLSPVFSRLGRLHLSGNSLHCNCELRWFRSWLAANRHRVIGDARCATPFDADMVSVSGKKMTCVGPSDLSVSRSSTDAGAVRLQCRAEGDPAPRISWFSPGGLCLGVSQLSSDRTRQETVYAVDLTSRIDLTPGVATYQCVATNLRGNASAELSLDAYNLISAGSNAVPVARLTQLIIAVFLSLLPYPCIL